MRETQFLFLYMGNCSRILTTGIKIGNLLRPVSSTSSEIENVLNCVRYWATKEGILSVGIEKCINDMSSLERFELLKRVRDW